MGAKHITAQEKELFQVLVNTGLSMQKVANLTGRDAGTVSNHVTSTVSNHLTSSDTKPVENIHLTQDEMFLMLDLHAQGMTCTQIGKEVDKAHGTVYKVINQLYPKHKKAYAKWLELQKEKDAPALVMEVQPVEPPALPAALLAIRAARAAGRTLHQEPVEVQTTKSESCDCDVEDSKRYQMMVDQLRSNRECITKNEAIIKSQILLIAECQETITLLKEHIQLLKSLR
jgi:transposase